jgi:hypothetical protein
MAQGPLESSVPDSFLCGNPTYTRNQKLIGCDIVTQGVLEAVKTLDVRCDNMSQGKRDVAAGIISLGSGSLRL